MKYFTNSSFIYFHPSSFTLRQLYYTVLPIVSHILFPCHLLLFNLRQLYFFCLSFKLLSFVGYMYYVFLLPLYSPFMNFIYLLFSPSFFFILLMLVLPFVCLYKTVLYSMSFYIQYIILWKEGEEPTRLVTNLFFHAYQLV